MFKKIKIDDFDDLDEHYMPKYTVKKFYISLVKE